jgi:hypothetical protein
MLKNSRKGEIGLKKNLSARIQLANKFKLQKLVRKSNKSLVRWPSRIGHNSVHHLCTKEFMMVKVEFWMSTSWLLGNVYTAKSCKGKKRDSDALKLGLVS